MNRLLFLLLCFLPGASKAQQPGLQLKHARLGTYDFQEITLTLPPVSAGTNPFTDTRVSATFITPLQQEISVEGFCDDPAGRVYKIRYMPRMAGPHVFSVMLSRGKKQTTRNGRFEVTPSRHRGILQVDPAHPTHFLFSQDSSHFFWNATTAYWMLGWKDESVIMNSIDRLASLGINRIRVAINGRSHGGSRWNEQYVVECPEFTFKLNPWEAKYPNELDTPHFDVSRFNVAHWQKMDRLIARAREKGIIVSFIFYVDGLDHGTDPFKKENMGNAYEQMYYAYAAARYAAFDNIMWDIANEFHLFRTPDWANQMGNFLRAKDPYGHLISVHGSSDFPFRKSPWVDLVMYQSWDECGGYPYITEARKAQAATGRILPTINEEYGYEGHYSVWGCGPTTAKLRPDGRDALNRSQLAWEICMAGAYQTTGETAEYGTGAGENTGGGWINGRGNNKMTMLRYYHIMKDCFEKTRFWELEPSNDRVSFGNMCLANPGKEYLIYTRAQHCRLQLGPNEKYAVWMIDPQTGEENRLPDADSNKDMNAWQYPKNLTKNMVFILKRIP
jgi:hypothetical protein